MNDTMSELKETMSTIDIKGFNFLIPSYQRGYKWDKSQVDDLLDDIYNFAREDEKGKFYCIQPLVVKDIKEDNFKKGDWEVVDGQQRLTTIYLILKYIGKIQNNDDLNNYFTMYFETRNKGNTFLISEISEVVYSNPDFYYISKVFVEYIPSYFDEHPDKSDLQLRLISKLTGDNERNIRFIWHEIEKENEKEVFSNMNTGKIPLTNAELIKALFLNRKNYEEKILTIKQIEIAKEWDEIELFMRNDRFWYFLTKKEKYQTCIDLLFEIYTGIENDIEDNTKVFRELKQIIDKELAKGKNINVHWSDTDNSIKKLFLSLRYFYEDHEYYHLIGFLTSIDNKFTDIYTVIKKNETLKEKKKLLRLMIIKKLGLNLTKDKKNIQVKIGSEIINLEDLNYEEHVEETSKILLLINILQLSKDIYFSFYDYKNTTWSLEHIHARADGSQEKYDEEKGKTYLNELLEKNFQIKEDKIENDKNTNTKDLKEKINQFLKINTTEMIKKEEEWNDLLLKIEAFFGDVNDKDNINNLALLSGSDNSSLGKSLFQEKRKRIIEKDKKGDFIPIATKNVFLKYYSSDTHDNTFWTEDDRKNYFNSIQNVLIAFFEDGR